MVEDPVSETERDDVSITRLMGILADFVGIFLAFTFIKSQIDELIVTLKFPEQLNFYFLFFWAFVSATVGGFVWNLFSRMTKTNVILTEPYGWSSFLWAIISNLPTIVTLILINVFYPYTSLKEQVFLYVSFLVGISVGAVIFYNIPSKGKKGFRNIISKGTWRTSTIEEFWLSILWTLLLSLGFLSMNLARYLIKDSSTFLDMVVSMLMQTGLFVSITVMAIMFGLIAFPRKERTETALGIVAGLFLKVALFFSLVFV